jgi:hypothetical protein
MSPLPSQPSILPMPDLLSRRSLSFEVEGVADRDPSAAVLA